jgi:hypothetical protein
MSERNGDKSRFHRERKQKIARRKRSHEMREQAVNPQKSEKTAERAKARLVSA